MACAPLEDPVPVGQMPGPASKSLCFSQASDAQCFVSHAKSLNRGFHVGDARLGGVRIFDPHVKIQHDAQWSILTRASIF